MIRFCSVGVFSAILANLALAGAVEAQERPLTFRVTPRSFLDPGPVAPPGTLNRYVTQPHLSYLTNPPWGHRRDQFGEGVLPDPIGGPFIGARNPFGDVDSTGAFR